METSPKWPGFSRDHVDLFKGFEFLTLMKVYYTKQSLPLCTCSMWAVVPQCKEGAGAG